MNRLERIATDIGFLIIGSVSAILMVLACVVFYGVALLMMPLLIVVSPFLQLIKKNGHGQN